MAKGHGAKGLAHLADFLDSHGVLRVPIRKLRRQRRARRRHAHRYEVGGYWGELGKLQLDFLTSQGLEPTSRFLDVGCGTLRAGVHLADYLDPGNYYGIDIDEQLLTTGYTLELSAEQRQKVPRDHLRCTDRFDVDFGVQFDQAIAQSVFTHISFNDIRLCLYRVARHMKIGGKFFVTFVEAPPDFPLDGVLYQERERSSSTRGPRKRYTERNPFWYWPGDLEWAASFAPWRFRYVGDWGHPRNQKMVELIRTP